MNNGYLTLMMIMGMIFALLLVDRFFYHDGEDFSPKRRPSKRK